MALAQDTYGHCDEQNHLYHVLVEKKFPCMESTLVYHSCDAREIANKRPRIHTSPEHG